jgi:hypothetical protein
MIRVTGLVDWLGSFFMFFFNWLFYYRFSFHEVISVLWPGSRVLVNSGRFFYFFFQFYPSTFVWLRIRFHNLFWFFLLSYHSLITRVMDLTWKLGLTQVNATYCYLNIKKKYYLKIFFSQTIFLMDFLLNSHIQLSYIESILR